MKRAWLNRYNWQMIESVNALLCSNKNHAHETTADGYFPAKDLWEENYLKEMSIFEAGDLCRKCHRLAPFKYFNGNTFVTIIRGAVSELDIDEAQATLLRSCLGHVVAGVMTREELAIIAKIEDEIQKKSTRG